MSSDRQLVLTRHDLHQLLGETDTPRPHPSSPDPSEYVREYVRTYWEDTPALPEKQVEGQYRRGRLRVVHCDSTAPFLRRFCSASKQ